ncbi:MAG: hypothetical protein ACKVZJ_13130 [Phycisphaerales bacterium]
MHDHELTDETLARLALGEVSDADAAKLRAAIQATPAAASRLGAIEGAVQRLRAAGTVEPTMTTSAEQRARLAALMKGRSESWLAQAARAGEAVATIVANTLRAPVHGYRGASTGGIIRAECEEVAIDFRVTAEPTSRGLLLVQGQVECATPARGLAAIGPDDENVTACRLEADGYFEVSLAPGTYRWELTTSDGGTVVIESFGIAVPDKTG